MSSIAAPDDLWDDSTNWRVVGFVKCALCRMPVHPDNLRTPFPEGVCDACIKRMKNDSVLAAR